MRRELVLLRRAEDAARATQLRRRQAVKSAFAAFSRYGETTFASVVRESWWRRRELVLLRRAEGAACLRNFAANTKKIARAKLGRFFGGGGGS